MRRCATLHVHNGVMDRKDRSASVDLVTAMMKRSDAGEVARIRDFARLRRSSPSLP